VAVKPLIGVTTSELRSPRAAERRGDGEPQPGKLRKHGEPLLPEMALGLPYVAALAAAGALPLVIPPLAPDDVPELVARLDGVVLSGGPDLAPSAYGAAAHRELGATEASLDAFEYAMAREAERVRLPTLGICRGAQAINVARGGTLHQHLSDVVGDSIVHRQELDGRRPVHPVELLQGSRLADLLGTTQIDVNSFHHQAIDELGTGLRPCAWAPDGTIEGIDDPELPFLIAVQWHAESLVKLPHHAELFRGFVSAAAGAAQIARAA
jgi:putative glutamine amidotransferase